MSFYEEISSNKRMTWILVGFFLIFIVIIGLVFDYAFDAGGFILILAVIFSIIYSLIAFWKSDSIVLAISRARPATKEENQILVNVAEEMTIASGIPMPKLYVIDDTAMNAFATGRDPEHGIVCVTTGLLAKMNREELQGVIAHEMSHIKNYDIRLMTIVSVLVGLSVLLSDLFLRMTFFGGGRRDSKGGHWIFIVLAIVLAILTPVIAQIINFSISRKREFLADASAAEMTRQPRGLANALRKLSGDKEILEAANKATAHLYIADPLKGQKMWMKSMFSTHPPIEERIKKLESM
ncbi:MAG: zinc metalloprotease HtpX [Candidatus Diapherotrites archaeon]